MVRSRGTRIKVAVGAVALGLVAPAAALAHL